MICHAEPFDTWRLSATVRINSAKHLYHAVRDPSVAYTCPPTPLRYGDAAQHLHLTQVQVWRAVPGGALPQDDIKVDFEKAMITLQA